MSIINPYTGLEISTSSRRFHDIESTGVFNFSKRLPDKKGVPKGTKGLKGKNDPLRTYLREGNYKKAFDYMFETGESVPSNVIGNVLNNLLGYSITFYCLKDNSFSTYIVSNSAKRKIVEMMVVPKTKCLAILGFFKSKDVMEQVKDFSKNKKVVYSPRSDLNYVKNEATGRMIRVGLRKYKELFPEAKKRVGRPSKRFDPISVFVESWNATGGPPVKDVNPSDLVTSWSGRKVMVTLNNGEAYVLDPERYKRYLTSVVRDGFAKHDILQVLITGKPVGVHEPNIEKVGVDSKTNKPIDPKILAKRTKLG